MKIDDIRDVINRATGLIPGGVKPEEIEAARRTLETGEGFIDGALKIVGLCGSIDDEKYIKKYLDPNHIEHHGEAALRSLCDFMGLFKKYKIFIMNKLNDKYSDDIGNIRLTAINVCCDYIKQNNDQQIIDILLEILLDCNEGDVDRIAVANSLAALLDIPPNEYLDIFSTTDPRFGNLVAKLKAQLHP